MLNTTFKDQFLTDKRKTKLCEMSNNLLADIFSVQNKNSEGLISEFFHLLSDILNMEKYKDIAFIGLFRNSFKNFLKQNTQTELQQKCQQDLEEEIHFINQEYHQTECILLRLFKENKVMKSILEKYQEVFKNQIFHVYVQKLKNQPEFIFNLLKNKETNFFKNYAEVSNKILYDQKEFAELLYTQIKKLIESIFKNSSLLKAIDLKNQIEEETDNVLDDLSLYPNYLVREVFLISEFVNDLISSIFQNNKELLKFKSRFFEYLLNNNFQSNSLFISSLLQLLKNLFFYFKKNFYQTIPNSKHNLENDEQLFKTSCSKIIKLLNFKQEKKVTKELETFICLQLIQNFNKEDLSLEKLFTTCLSEGYGVDQFENLKNVGMSIEANTNILHSEFNKMKSKTQLEFPSYDFNFLLFIELNKLKIPELEWNFDDSIIQYQNFFSDFFYKHYNTSFKKCSFLSSLGSIELEMKNKKKSITLLLYPFQAFILQQLQGKILSLEEMFSSLCKNKSGENRLLFLKCVQSLVDEELIMSLNGFEQLGPNFDKRIQINKRFLKKCVNKQSKHF